MTHIYTFVRKDLTAEQKIVQIGHVCFEAGKQFTDPSGISSLVLLESRDENDLLEIGKTLDEKGIDYYIFFEPDFDTGYTAICTRPVREKERSIFKKWKLFKNTD